MTLGGTDCRAEENCAFPFDFSGGADGGVNFGGFSGGDGGILVIENSDAGIPSQIVELDAGIETAGAISDAGVPVNDTDASVSETPTPTDAGVATLVDGGPGDVLDGGMSYIDAGMGDETEITEELGFWETNGFKFVRVLLIAIFSVVKFVVPPIVSRRRYRCVPTLRSALVTRSQTALVKAIKVVWAASFGTPSPKFLNDVTCGLNLVDPETLLPA